MTGPLAGDGGPLAQVGPLILHLEELVLTDAPTRLVAAVSPLAALVGAAVFVAAGVTKSLDPAVTASRFAGLGLPRPQALALAVPVAELAIAAALLLRPAVGGAAATAALLAFTAVLVAALRSGRVVSCGCLGPLDRGPISERTIARNVGLLVVVALASAAPDHPGLRTALPDLALLLAAGSLALLAALGWQLAALRRRTGRIWSVALAGETGRPGTGSGSIAASPAPVPAPTPITSPTRQRHLEASAS